MGKNSRSYVTAFLCVLLGLLLLGGCGKRPETAAEATPTPQAATPGPAVGEQTQVTIAATPTPEPETTPEPTPEPTPTPAPLAIRYNNGVVNSVTVQAGASFTLTAEGATADVTFSSDNENVASCDAAGHVTALKEGTASITATDGESSSVCKITVTAPPAPDVTICFWSRPLSDFTLNASASETIQLTAVLSPADTTAPVVWSVSDSKVAEISETGLVTALSEGTATIYCKCGGGEAECILRVRGVRPTFTPVAEEAESDEPALVITFAGYLCSDFTLPVGQGIDLSYKLYNAQNNGAVWSIENPNVATVDQNGYVTGVSVGDTKLFCSCGGMTAECIVRIK